MNPRFPVEERAGIDPEIRAKERSGKMPIEERIDRSPARGFAVLTIAYGVAVLALSHMKLLWLDELITLHIARLDSASAIWTALAQGADPNPPLSHLLVHWSRTALGDDEWAYRLPAMLGYWTGMLSLFAYLRGKVPGTWAIGGTVLSMTMAAFDYSYESRSYGIFYGLAMLAFLSWAYAVNPLRSGRRRAFALVGLVIALAAGISTNYFAVLAFFPVGVGEVVRMAQRALEERNAHGSVRMKRVIDWPVWIAMAVAASPLLLYRELIAHAIAQFAPYAWNKVSIDQAIDSYSEMVEIVLYPILGLFAFAAGMWFSARSSKRDRRELSGLPAKGKNAYPLTPAHELAGVFVLMAYPLLGYVVASIRGGMLSPRFVIPVCFGFAISATLVACRAFDRIRRAGLVFLCFVSAWFLCREAVVGYWYQEQKQCFYKVLDRLPEALSKVPADAPIAIPDSLLALTFQHYAPPQIARRVVFPMDFPAIRRFRGDDSPEENLWAGRRVLYSMPIETLAEFQSKTAEFLIIAASGNWMLEDLSEHHHPVRRLPIKTRATELGGFTPLARGVPSFYVGEWDAASSEMQPMPFRAEDNIPNAQGDVEGNDGK